MNNRTRITGAALVAAMLAAGSASAVHFAETWNNSESDNDFTNPLNWSNGTNGPLYTLTSTNDTWSGVIDLADDDYSEYNLPGGEVFVKALNVGTTAEGEFRLVDGILNSQNNANGGPTYNRTVIGQGGFSGTFIQSGGTYLANKVHVGYNANSSGTYIMSGGTLENGGGEGNFGSSLIIAGNGVNAGMTGLFEISGGAVSNFIRGVELGNTAGSIGTFHVVGTGPDAIICGDNINYGGAANAYATWNQASNSVLKVGIDETLAGVTPIQIVDMNAEGRNDVEFQAGALLEPYFTGAAQTGKWSVLVADDFIDYGIEFAPSVTDPDWSFTITNNTLELWYGLGDSGYVSTSTPPSTVYVAGAIVWDGEAGDNDWDNPVNWNYNNENDNNTLPLEGNNGAWPYIETADPSNFPIYTADYGTRAYNRLFVGYASTQGRLDLIGARLNLSQGTPNWIGSGLGGTGTVNVVDGGWLNYSANVVLIGHGTGVGTLNVENGSTVIFGRGNNGDSVRVGQNNGAGTINVSGGSTLKTRTGFELWGGVGNPMLSVKGSGNTIGIGSQGSVDGFWWHRGGTLQMLVDTNGVSTILIDDYGDDGTGGDAYFYAGSELDVDFTGWAGGNGTWDVMKWEGSLMESNLVFAAGVDTSVWSMEYVDTDATNGVDTLRIKATGFGPEVQPNITDFSVSGSTVSLSWDSELGIFYNVLSRSDLVNADWTTNAAAIPGAGSTTSTNLPGPGAIEFYQIEAYE